MDHQGSAKFKIFVLQSESEVAQSCPTLCDPMDCSLSGFSVHRIFQVRVLEWGAIAFSKITYSIYIIKDIFLDSLTDIIRIVSYIYYRHIMLFYTYTFFLRLHIHFLF